MLNPATIQQKFSFPENIVYYLSKHPSLALNISQKLIKSCKYFLLKQSPFFVVVQSVGDSAGYPSLILPKGENQKMNFMENKKLCVCGNINIHRELNKKFISNLLNKNIIYCHVSRLSLGNQELSHNDFILLTRENVIIHFTFVDTIIRKNDDGSILPFEKVIEKLVNVEIIEYIENNLGTTITHETAKNLFKLQNFKSNGCMFFISGIPEYFDATLFCIFAKNNERCLFDLERGGHSNITKVRQFRDILAKQKVTNVSIY